MASQTATNPGVTFPLGPTEPAFRHHDTLDRNEIRLVEQQRCKLINVKLAPARLLTEPVVPALDIVVGPDG